MKKISIRDRQLDLNEILQNSRIPALSGNQLARRLVTICKKTTSDYNVFDTYMKTYGVFTIEPTLKPVIRLTLLALVRDKLLIETHEGYQATDEAVEEAERFVEYDTAPTLLEAGKQSEVAAAALAARISISTSTSTSCDCTSSSSSSATSHVPLLQRAGYAVFDELMGRTFCYQRIM